VQELTALVVAVVWGIVHLLIAAVRVAVWAIGMLWALLYPLVTGQAKGWEDGTPGASAGVIAQTWGTPRAWAWKAGQRGEELAADELRKMIPFGWVWLWDRGVAGSRVNVDGVGVSARGHVVAADAKYLAGPVTCRRGTIYNGDERFSLGGIAFETVEVSRILGCPVEPVVCVEGGWIRWRGHYAWQGNMRIFVGSTAAVRRHLRRSPRVMSRHAAERLAEDAKVVLPRRHLPGRQVVRA
jgi:hypothetical protein